MTGLFVQDGFLHKNSQRAQIFGLQIRAPHLWVPRINTVPNAVFRHTAADVRREGRSLKVGGMLKWMARSRDGPKRRHCNVHNELTPKRRGPTASVAATCTFAPRGNTLRCTETANAIWNKRIRLGGDDRLIPTERLS